MSRNPVGWFEIYVDDMARARRFYEAVFQRTLEKQDTTFDMWAFPMDMDAGGASGALVHIPGLSAGGNSVLVYFSCADCAVEEALVLQHGGRVECSKMSIGQYGFISLVFDSEGNMFGLHSLQ